METNPLEDELLESQMEETDLEQAEPSEIGEPIAEVEPGHGLHAGPLADEAPITIDEVV